MRRDSRRARALCNELAHLGADTSLRQLERLDEFGLLGDGSQPVGPSLAKRAVEAGRLVDEHGSGDRAAIVMFFRGYDFAPDRVVKAYMTYLERIEGWIEKQAGAHRGLAAAERIATKLAAQTAKSADERPIREQIGRLRSGRPFMSIKQWLVSIYSDAVLILTDGHASSEQALRELLEATDVAALTRESLPGRPPPVPVLPLEPIKQMLGQMRLSHQAAIVATASYQQLCLAREDTVALVGFAKVFAPVARRAFGLRLAYGFAGIAQLSELACGLLIPSMVLMRHLRPRELDELRETIELQTPRFTAMNQLLDAIPERFYPAAQTAARIHQLSREDQEELKAVIRGFETTQPAAYTLVMSDFKPLPVVKYG